MTIGVIMMSLGLKKVLGYVGGEDCHSLADPIYGVPLAALCGGAVLYLLAHVGFKRYMTGALGVERLVVVALPALLTRWSRCSRRSDAGRPRGRAVRADRLRDPPPRGGAPGDPRGGSRRH
jgi:Bacterial low temperature requirement A protein (LtrA)